MSGTEALSVEQRDAVARAVHDAYVATASAGGQTTETNASLAGWSDLPETLRDSNRAQADDIVVKLAAIDCAIVDAVRVSAPFEFAVDEVERLARAEHDRWWRNRERDGWTHGPVKDADRKQHPDLVPWDELSESARQLDRDAVLAIPRVLEAAGLAVARASGEAS